MGPGTVQGDTRDDILQVLGLQLLHEAFHPAAFQLEHAVRPAGAERIQHFFIVIIQIAPYRASRRCHAQSYLTAFWITVRVRSPRKSIFRQSQLLQRRHRKLGGDRTVRRLGKAAQTRSAASGQITTPCRVHGGMSAASPSSRLLISISTCTCSSLS